MPKCLPEPDENGKEVPYYPKGAIANSYFTDTYTLIKNKDKDNEEKVFLNTTNISWKSDKESKFLLPANWKNWKRKSSNFVVYVLNLIFLVIFYSYFIIATLFFPV